MKCLDHFIQPTHTDDERLLSGCGLLFRLIVLRTLNSVEARVYTFSVFENDPSRSFP